MTSVFLYPGIGIYEWTGSFIYRKEGGRQSEPVSYTHLEKGDSQIFWVELLTTVFGVTEISQFISFEDQVHLDHTSFIDGYIEKTHVMIEQKSINKSLTAAIRQSDGSMLTPFEQAKRYSSELPYSKRPRWIVTSNFQSFYIYDMEKPGGDPEIIQRCV